MEDLHRCEQFVRRDADHVGVGAVAEHHRLLLHRPPQRAQIVAQPGRLLEIQLGGRRRHLLLQPADHRVGLARHEVAEVHHDLAVFLGGDLAGARRGALADVAEQARPADLLRPPEHPGRARPGREHPQQHVERFPDGPGMGVRPEVPDALAVRTAHHLQPGVLLAEGDGEFRVGLVVAVPHVEPRVELLDPVVFQLQRLDLGGHHRPLHARRAGDHLRGARVQRTEIGEIRIQPLPQALGLADVDDPVRGIAEAIDAGRVRDRARGGAIEGWIRHTGEGNPHATTVRSRPASSLPLERSLTGAGPIKR